MKDMPPTVFVVDDDVSFGGFLKRLIDERIKLPISEHWSEGGHFHFSACDGKVTLETGGPRLVAALAYGT